MLELIRINDQTFACRHDHRSKHQPHRIAMAVVRRSACLVLMGWLTGCAIGAFEAPIGTSETVPEGVDRLQIGQSRRQDVRGTLGGDPVTLLSASGFELYQMSTGRSSTVIVLLFPMIPLPLSGRQLEEGRLRVLAAYDETGVLRSLDWEHAHFAESPLRDERQEPLSEPLITGFEEPGGALVVDAHGSAGTMVSVDPAALPRPRLVWEADTVMAAQQAALASLGEAARRALSIRDLASGSVVASTILPAEACGAPPHAGWLDPDGRHVLVVSAGGIFCLWDMGSHEPATALATSASDTRPQAGAVAYARNASVAAIYDAGTRTVGIWAVPAGERRSTLPAAGVVALALDGSGERLALLDDEMALSVLSTSSGEELARTRLSGPRLDLPRATGLAIAPDGRTIAVNRASHVELWRLTAENDSERHQLQLATVLLLPLALLPPEGTCRVAVAFSGDGGRLAAGCNSAVVWSTTTWRELFRLVPDGEGRIGGAAAWIDEGFAFSADGRAILTNHGVWDVPDPGRKAGS